MTNFSDTLGNHPELAIWLALFTVVSYLYFTESAFMAFVVYATNYLKSVLFRIYTNFRVNPKSPIFLYYKFMAALNADREAKKFAKEMGLDKDPGWKK